uniref:mandelate racemase/muconate lactonizing enzyme family protein n=1 Tax=Ningiella ruwaisensis TaxID=2364274 RepID=UPI0014481ADB|nr:mandelate racemase/muconate lactonizing enzyme family protein [Ningiella ruwaisensis]
MKRRDLLKLSAGVAATACLGASTTILASSNSSLSKNLQPNNRTPNGADFDAILQQPVLKRDLFKTPVTIEKLELLNKDDEFIVRVTDKEGRQGLSLCNSRRADSAWPMILTLVKPTFEGKDARDLEALLHEVYITSPNYKFQGLAFWSCVAWVEIAILDLLGKIAKLPLWALIGEKQREKIGLYHANGDRKNSAEWVIRKLESLLEESGARALKYKLGARMHYTEASTARDKKLIPGVRKHFGDDVTLYADANGSYDIPMSLYMGKMLEEHDYGFFEEPVPFDYLEETKAVTDQLAITVAGGEQETSMWRFKWLIANRALTLVQPDLIYFGGLIRSMRVARMAQLAGLPCVPHISGLGLGQLYMAHFVTALPNTTDFQEYKGDRDKVPYVLSGTNKRYKAKDGYINAPQGVGLGITFDPEYIAEMKEITSSIPSQLS